MQADAAERPATGSLSLELLFVIISTRHLTVGQISGGGGEVERKSMSMRPARTNVPQQLPVVYKLITYTTH